MKTLLYFFIFLLNVSMGCGEFIISTMPDNAFVFVDEKTSTYYAPPCVMKNGYNNEGKINEFGLIANLKVMRVKDIRADKYKPDDKCREASGFIEEKGLIGNKERWNDNGTWNY